MIDVFAKSTIAGIELNNKINGEADGKRETLHFQTLSACSCSRMGK